MLFESVLIFEFLLSCNIKMYSLGSRFLVKFALKKKKKHCNCGWTTGACWFHCLEGWASSFTYPHVCSLGVISSEESRDLPFLLLGDEFELYTPLQGLKCCYKCTVHTMIIDMIDFKGLFDFKHGKALGKLH